MGKSRDESKIFFLIVALSVVIVSASFLYTSTVTPRFGLQTNFDPKPNCICADGSEYWTPWEEYKCPGSEESGKRRCKYVCEWTSDCKNVESTSGKLDGLYEHDSCEIRGCPHTSEPGSIPDF